MSLRNSVFPSPDPRSRPLPSVLNHDPIWTHAPFSDHNPQRQPQPTQKAWPERTPSWTLNSPNALNEESVISRNVNIGVYEGNPGDGNASVRTSYRHENGLKEFLGDSRPQRRVGAIGEGRGMGLPSRNQEVS